MTTRRRLATVALAIAGLAVLAPSAPAASWLEPVNLDTPAVFNNGDPDPVVAVNARGDMLAAWELDTDANAGSGLAVRVAYRPAGGALSVKSLPRAAGAQSRNPSVGIDAAGNGFVAWEDAVGEASVVKYAVRAPGGSEWVVEKLAGSTNQPAKDAVVTVASGGLASGGLATFVWRRKNLSQTTYYLEAARRTAGTALSGVENVSTVGSSTIDVRRPAVLAATPGGDTTAAWVIRDVAAVAFYQLQSARAADGNFGAPETIATGGAPSHNGEEVAGITDPALALDAQARAVLTFVRVDTPDDVFGDYVLYYVPRAANSAKFGTNYIEIVSASLHGGTDVAIDSQGNAIAVWGRTASGNMVLEAKARPQGGSFGTLKTVSDVSLLINVFDARVAFDSSGTAIAVWSQCTNSACRIASSRRPPAGEFDGVGYVTPDARYRAPRIATDDDGNAVVVAQLTHANPKVAVLAAYDGGAPELRSLAVPASGTTGRALSFSVAPFDVWSPVTVTWSFGDAATATGTAPKHAYAAPGVYTVTITAKDAAGNTASATRTVLVTTPPPPPPGLDGDGDGFTAGQDCNDSDPAIRPGATEIRGNTIDENCDGRAEPFAAITSPVSITWGVAGKRTKLMRLKVRQLPAGAKVRLRCSGPGCPFKRKSAGRVRDGKVNALKAFGDKRILRAGAVLEIRITAPERIGKIVRYKTRDGKPPKVSTLCLRPGAKTPQRSC